MTASERATLPLDLGQGPFTASTDKLSKRFGPVTALDRVGLQVPEGAVYVLVGPNGAGKSTLLRTLLGLVRRDEGRATVLGADPGTEGARVRAGVGYVPEDHRIGYPWMTVGRLLSSHATYYPSWDSAYAHRLMERWQVDPTRRCPSLSKGHSRRVQLVMALAHRPPVLLMDEPTDGLDPVMRDDTLSVISEHLADFAATVLLSTHRVYEVEALVDHVGVLSEGRLLGQLRRDELHRRLLRYWADVPDGWSGSPELNGRVIKKKGGGRQVEWTVWGDPDDVTGALSRGGAKVREVAPLSVEESAIALLSRKEAP